MSETLQLLNRSIDFSTVLPEVYDHARASWDKPLTNERIARMGLCSITTVAMTEILQAEFSRFDNPNMQAHSEVHTIGWGHHSFTVVTRSPEKQDEIVVDSTYKQFIKPERAQDYPNLFIGTRAGIIAVMQSVGCTNYVADYYRPHTHAEHKDPEAYLHLLPVEYERRRR